MKALVLSGGGCKGAYEAGAIRHLLACPNMIYDIYCGISVGALNAAFLAQFPDGEEDEASAALAHLWKSFKQSDVYKSWFPLGRLSWWKPSQFNSSPLRDTVVKYLDPVKVRKSGKKLRIGAVAMDGEYRVFTEDSDCIIEAVLASAAFPVMLTPVEIDGKWWIDGGVKNITPLHEAIDAGANEADVIVTFPLESVYKDASEKPNQLDVAFRTIELMSDEIAKNDLKIAHTVNHCVLSGITDDKRYVELRVMAPEKTLIKDSLDFSRSKLNRMFDLGYKQAQKDLPCQ